MNQGKLQSRTVGDEVTLGQLTDWQQKALQAALNVSKKAHNFYSGFSVGAALVVAKRGALITGANFENAAYGSTICAERAAVLRANSEGHRDFEGIAITARDKDQNAAMPSPCGSCRQVLWELARLCNRDLYVILSTQDENRLIRTTVGELLPLAFGSNSISREMDEYRERWAKAAAAS